MSNASNRSPEEILRSHLEYSLSGNVNDDMRKNYSPDLVILTGWDKQIYHGYEGMRLLAALLEAQIPGADFEYKTILVEGDVGFLEWTADAPHARILDGADSYVFRDGKIVAQTIHYTVTPK